MIKSASLTCLSLSFLTACGGVGSSSGSSSGGSSALNVSGTLSVATASQKIAQAIPEDRLATLTADLSQYKVVCATNSVPVKHGTGTVNSDGTFSVNIDGAAGEPMSCFMVDSSDTKVADFLISDSSNKDLNGNSQVSSSAAFKSDASLGSVSLDLNAGEVTVPASHISDSLDTTKPTTGSVFDPTGAWTIGSVDFTVPAGVKSPCASNANHDSCHGPTAGQEIYLKRWKGSKVSDSTDVYGLQVWEGLSKFQACGSKIGLTTTAKNQIGVDFSANGTTADSTFTFPNSVTFTDQILSASSTPTLTDGWKMSTAKTQWSMNSKCGPQDITLGTTAYSNAWVCGPDNGSRYQVSLGGGCVDSANKPVQVNNWSGMSCGSPTIDTAGIRNQTCTGTASVNGQSTTVTCTNKWAITDSSYVAITNPATNFAWNDLTQIASGTLCSAMPTTTEQDKISQLQCYAQYYQNSGIRDANACLPKVDMDWSAKLASRFTMVDDIRPEGLVFFEQYKAFPDGSGGSLLTRQEHFDGVSLDGTSWVNCRVIETGGLTIKKVSDSKLLVSYQSSTITTSLTKPACLAKFNGARETYLFYMTK